MKNILSYRKPALKGDSIPELVSQKISKLENGDQVLESLPSLLNGQNSIEQIFGKLLIDGSPANSIYAVFELLENNNLLIDDDFDLEGGLSFEEKSFYAPQIQLMDKWSLEQQNFDSYGTISSGTDAQSELKRSTILVIGEGRLAKDLVISLAKAGIGAIVSINTEQSDHINDFKEKILNINPHINYEEILRETDLSSSISHQEPDLIVYCPDNFDDEICENYNKIALETKIPFLFSRQDSISIEIGPMVIPYETACFTCYRQRREAAQSASNWLSSKQNNQGYLPYFYGNEFLSLEIIKFLSKIAQTITRGRLWRLNLMRGITDVHPVLKLPRCPTCGVHRYNPPSKLWEE